MRTPLAFSHTNASQVYLFHDDLSTTETLSRGDWQPGLERTRNLTIRERLDWENRSSLAQFAQDSLFVINLKVGRQAQRIDNQDFREALVTILGARALFLLSTSAVAAFLRYCLKDVSKPHLQNSAAISKCGFRALGLQSGSQLCILARGMHSGSDAGLATEFTTSKSDYEFVPELD